MPSQHVIAQAPIYTFFSYNICLPPLILKQAYKNISHKPDTMLGILMSEERKAQSALTTYNQHKEKNPLAKFLNAL